MSGNMRARSVLIVDDDPSFALLLEEYLVQAGHEVLVASNGREAMKLLRELGPQMVIADFVMPEMDGLELCRAIRASDDVGFVYLIILTAHSERERMIEAFDAGADDFLTKPFERQELLARLRAGRRMVELQANLDRRNREIHLAHAEMAQSARQLESANRRLKVLATIDELTGLLNRREALDRLEQQWAASDRHGEPLSCIVVDIDHFKAFNDSHGHAVGDLVLRETARTLRQLGRTSEDVCRIGGEEFLVICPRAPAELAAAAAERLRRAVESRLIHVGHLSLKVTISLGVAERTKSMDTPDDLLRAADFAMYAAKVEGRNRVSIAQGVAVFRRRNAPVSTRPSCLAGGDPAPFRALIAGLHVAHP